MSVERTAEDPAAESKDSGRQLDLLEEIGGPQGVATSSIPALVFVAIYALGGNRISLAGICAIGAGLAIAALRLARGESLRFALAGFVGVAVAAFIADRTGRAEDFFLPGLLLNAAYGAVFLISILIRRPLLGAILAPALGEAASWRENPRQLARLLAGELGLGRRLRDPPRRPAAVLPGRLPGRPGHRQSGHGAADLRARGLALVRDPEAGRHRGPAGVRRRARPGQAPSLTWGLAAVPAPYGRRYCWCSGDAVRAEGESMLTQVADGVWVRQSEWVWTNSIVVRGEDGLILVDPGIDGSELNQLADDLDRLGIPVVAGFSTHPHWDHLLWHPRFGDVPRYATPAGANAAGEARERAQAMAAESASGIPLELIALVTPLPADGGPVPGEIIEHQAHAVGHAAILLADRGVLLAGDMLSDVLIPLFDPRQADQVGAYETALDRLGEAARHVDVVVPGHGAVAEGPEVAARLAADRAYIDALRRGEEPVDARLEAADWLSGPHRSNLEQARGR